MDNKENTVVETETDILELLLSATPKLPEKELVMTRLSDELGVEVRFRIRALSYTTITEFIRGKGDFDLRVVMEGLVSPSLKDTRLLMKYNAATPLELLKKTEFLLPGEVAELALEINQLSGYGDETFKEVIKN